MDPMTAYAMKATPVPVHHADVSCLLPVCCVKRVAAVLMLRAHPHVRPLPSFKEQSPTSHVIMCIVFLYSNMCPGGMPSPSDVRGGRWQTHL